VIRFDESISEIVAADTTDFHERDPETFFASHMGLCPRQLYLSKLGLTANSDLQGQYRVARLIQTYLEEQLSDQYPRLETEASLHIDEGPIQFVGRCNVIDPENEIVYSLKTRNGWYKFSPPVDRHLDQLHVYMRGLDITRGRIVYVSKNDIGDVREWPPPDNESPYVDFDRDRYDQLVEKAMRIRDAIWTNGIASTPEEIPFQDCGCYFCNEERLVFPDATDHDRSDRTKPSSETDAPATATSSDQSLSVEGPTDEQEQPTTFEADGGSDPPVPTEVGPTVLQSDDRHVPAGLRELDVWVVWDGRSKVALAPWQEGTMYPCEWAAAKDIDPRRSFGKARMVAELPVNTIHDAWPFPDEDDLPERVKPAVLLPHDPPTPPVSFVDLDDVRDPETGAVPKEAATIIEMLGGYAELSASGTGVHVYVRGRLPNGVGAFMASLADRGTIEIYDHSRFTGGTWRHIKDTPVDTVPDAQDVITDLVAQYNPAPD